jgi:hypothetical protein
MPKGARSADLDPMASSSAVPDSSQGPPPLVGDGQTKHVLKAQSHVWYQEKSPSEPVYAIEICCGHAGLTAALVDVGFQGIGIDWKGNKHHPVIPILQLDLTDPADQEQLMHLLATHNVKYVHMGPPCGTYTRARDKPISAHLLKAGCPNPQPLRSEQYPAGLPNLHNEGKEIDLVKVEKANVLTDMCARISDWCIDKGVAFTIENPTNSHIWGMPSMKVLA